jgi:hypothetical protein
VGRWTPSVEHATLLAMVDSMPSTLLLFSVLGLTTSIACAELSPRRPEAGGTEFLATHVSVRNRSTQALNRRSCSAVMVLVGDEAKKTINDELLSDLEGHLISRGLRVVSSGITGRVVSEPGLVEGAAQLPPLERAIVLAKTQQIGCVFQLLDIRATEDSRYFVWSGRGRGMTESSRENIETVDPGHIWTLTGPAWEIHGKVIDVEGGDVLAIVDLWQSTVRAVKTQVFRVPFASDSLTPTPMGQRGWVISRVEDTNLLQTSMMSLLAIVIAWPPDAAAIEKDLDRAR